MSSNRGVFTTESGRKAARARRRRERQLTLRHRWYAGALAATLSAALAFSGMPAAVAEEALPTPTPTESAELLDATHASRLGDSNAGLEDAVDAGEGDQVAPDVDGADLESLMTPFVAGPEPVAGPAVYWEARSTAAGNPLVGGALFELEGQRVSGGNWGTKITVEDNTGQPGYTGADLDPDAGEFQVQQIGGNPVTSAGRYRVQKLAAPVGYAVGSTGWTETSGSGNTPAGGAWVDGRWDAGDFTFPPAATRSHTINVQKGDLRTRLIAGNSSNGYNVAGTYTQGARFALYQTGTSTTPISTCEITAAGQPCTFANVNASGVLYVGELDPAPGSPAAAHYSAPLGNLTTGTTSGFTNRPYRYATASLSSSADQTVTVPSAPSSTNAWDQSSGSYANRLANPQLALTCGSGIDIALVVDLSGSVVPNKDTLKDAQNAFIDALAGTGSRVALFSFGNVSPRAGTQNTGLLGIDDPAGLAALKATTANYYDNTLTNQGTNWDAGLWSASANAGQYDLVIVLTDGNPTFSGTSSDGTQEGSGSGSLTTFRELERAVFSANVIKDKGARLITFGIGAEGAVSDANLAAVSGPVGWATGASSLNDFDFINAEWSALTALLEDFAQSIACEATVSVTKLTQVGSAAPTPAPGWGFTLGTTGDGTPDGTTGVTGPDGSTGWTVAFDESNQTLSSVTLTEDLTAQPGWIPSGAACTVNGTAFDTSIDPQTGSLTLADLAVGIGGKVSCIVTNKQAPASWTLAKTSNPQSGSTVQPGAKIEYTLTAHNTSAVPVTDAVVTDDLSGVLPHATAAGITDITPSGAATVSGTTLTWSVGTLPAGATRTLSYTVTVAADARGVTLRNAVTGTGSVPPDACVPGAPCETTHVVPAPGFELTKSASPATGSAVNPGQSVTYTVTGVNTGDTVLNPVVITDDLSDVIDNATYNADAVATIAGSPAGGTLAYTEGTLTWTGSLPAGETVTIVYSVTVNTDAGGQLLNNVVTGEATPPGQPPIVPPPVETEHPVPAWTLAKRSDPASGSTVSPGAHITYTLIATNDSDAAVADVIVVDDLARVLAHTGDVSSITAFVGSAAVTGETLTWTVGALAAKSTATLSYTVTVDEDAYGVTLVNAVTGTGSVPPEACTPEAACETTHETDPVWSLAKTSNPASGSTVKPGDTITYTVTATNPSAKAIDGVVVTDELTNVLNNAVLTTDPTASFGSVALAGTTLTWTVGSLPANATETVTYTVTVNEDALGVTIGNVVSGVGDVPPSACTPEAPCETEHKTPAWTLTKTSDPVSGATVLPGSTITYTLTATNTSDVDAENIVVTDDLSNVLNHAALTTGPTASAGTAAVAGNTLTWNVGTLASGAEATATYTVTVNADALGVTIGNVVSGEGSVPPSECTPEAPCETTHNTPEVWSLSKTSDPASGSTVKPGDTITYTVTATNSSAKAVAGVVVTDSLANVLNNAKLTAGPTTSVGSAAVSGNTLTWNLGSLAANSTATVTYTVTVNADALGVTIGNVVSGKGSVPPEECTPEEPCETTHETDPVWSLAKTSNPASGSTVKPGDTIAYTVTATNPSSKPVTGVVVTDSLANVLNNAALAGDPTASVGAAAVAGNTLTWTLGTLEAGATATVTYTVTVNADALGVTIGNVVSGDGSVPPSECTPENPCETEHATPAWTLTKSSNPASGSTVKPGDKVTYTVTATNTSDADAKSIVVTDDLSSVLNNAALDGNPTATVGTAAVAGNTLTWTLGTLASGATQTVTYTVTVNANAVGVTLKNVVTGTGDVPPGECPTDDPNCRETEHPTPAWTLVKDSDPASGSTVKPGATITYTLKAKNTSDALLAGATAVDDLSKVVDNAKLTEPLAAGLALSEDGKTLTWTIPTLAAGAEATVSYTVTVNADAYGVTIGNVVTGEGPVPPGECPTDDPDCRETEHPTPAWTIKKESDPASGSTVVPGQDIVYTLTVQNVSDAVVTGETAIDDLSNVLNNAELLTASIHGKPLTFDASAKTLTWAIPTLQPGQSTTVSYTVTVNDNALGVWLRNVVTSPGSVPCVAEEPSGFFEGLINGITRLFAGEPTADELCPTSTEHPTPAWTLTKSSDPASGATVKPGQDVVYTLTAKNTSDAVLSGATAVDDLTDVVAHAVLKQPLAGGLALSEDGTTLTWTIPELAAGAEATVSYTATVNADALGVTLKNVVTGGGDVPPGECPTDDPNCRETEHPTPAWTLTKDSDPASGSTVLPGETITYTLTATNTSDALLEGATAVDDLSSVLDNAKLVEPLADGLSLAGTTLTWDFGTLEPGATATVTYRATVNAGAFGVTIGNVVTGGGDVPPAPCATDDPNCRETEHFTPGWTLEKKSDPKSGSEVKAGQKVTYTLTAHNTSKVDVAGAKAIDDMSKVLNNATLVTPLDAALNLSGTTLTWSIPALAPGESASVSYQVVVNTFTQPIQLKNVVTPEGPGGECLPDACTTTHPGGELPVTGGDFSVAAWLGGGLLLAAGGSALLLGKRRKERANA